MHNIINEIDLKMIFIDSVMKTIVPSHEFNGSINFVKFSQKILMIQNKDNVKKSHTIARLIKIEPKNLSSQIKRQYKL